MTYFNRYAFLLCMVDVAHKNNLLEMSESEIKTGGQSYMQATQTVAVPKNLVSEIKETFQKAKEKRKAPPTLNDFTEIAMRNELDRFREENGLKVAGKRHNKPA